MSRCDDSRPNRVSEPPVSVARRPVATTDRAIAVVYGVVCHASFGLAIATMVASMATGMVHGQGPFGGVTAALCDALLLAAFALPHSFLLGTRGRASLRRLAPRGLGGALATTIYATVASWQLLLVFGAWSPIGPVWWRPEGTALVVLLVAYAASWLLLLKSMADAGLAVQTGYLGWSAVARARAVEYPEFRVRGTFRYVRQPIYLAFALTLWTAPVWTPDRLLLALGWTAYCLVGPRRKEARYLGFHGRSYARYRELVPYWIPRLRGLDPELVGCTECTASALTARPH